jgi:hypothetical protein
MFPLFFLNICHYFHSSLSILWTSEKTVVVLITLLVLDRPPGSRLVPEVFEDVTIHQSLTVTEGCVGIKDVFQLAHSNWNRSGCWQTSRDSQVAESDISSGYVTDVSNDC